jgi:two-component system CheB/CheR fusion protein
MMSSINTSHPLRIFVVENHPDTLQYLRMYLEQLGHKVASAETMRSALDRMPKEKWDVLISDIGLPDGTGWDLLKNLAQARARINVAMSGFGMHSDVMQSTAAGFQHHLIKPFQPEELDEILEEAEATAP